MNEKLAKKLKKILAKAGLDEEKINSIVDAVEEAVTEEEAPEDVDPEEAEAEVSEEEVVEEPDQVVEEAPVEEEAPNEEVLPPQEEVAQENDGSIEAALNELAAQEGVAPNEAQVPGPEAEAPLPTIDPSEVQKLQNDLAEANKTIEGLVARIDSLEEALKGAGVITSNSKLGDENPRLTPNASANQEDAFDDILNVINGK